MYVYQYNVPLINTVILQSWCINRIIRCPAVQAVLGPRDDLYAYFCRQFTEEMFRQLLLQIYLIIKGTAGQSDDWTRRSSLKEYF